MTGSIALTHDALEAPNRNGLRVVMIAGGLLAAVAIGGVIVVAASKPSSPGVANSAAVLPAAPALTSEPKVEATAEPQTSAAPSAAKTLPPGTSKQTNSVATQPVATTATSKTTKPATSTKPVGTKDIFSTW